MERGVHCISGQLDEVKQDPAANFSRSIACRYALPPSERSYSCPSEIKRSSQGLCFPALILKDDPTNELKERFHAFHNAYEQSFRQMVEEGIPGAIVAVKVWERSLKLVPLTKDELMRFKIYVVTRSKKSVDQFA